MSTRNTRRQLGCLTLVALTVVLLPSAALYLLLGALRGAPLPRGATEPREGLVNNDVPDDVPADCGLRVRAAYYTDYLSVPGEHPWQTRLRFAPEGPSPIGSVTVWVRPLGGDARRLVARAREVVELRGLPCGTSTEVGIEGDDDSAVGAIPSTADFSEAAVLELSARPSRTVEGVVVSTQGGAPVEGAFVYAETAGLSSARSGADGRFTWRGGVGPKARDDLDPTGPVWLRAEAVGFDGAGAEVPSPAGPEAPPVVTLQLRPNHDIIVHCEFPDATGCPGELWCTGPLPLGGRQGRCQVGHPLLVERHPDAVLCACPSTGATLRGMGLLVAVPDGVRELTLEPPGGAGLRGQVLGLDPGSFHVRATRVPLALEDLPRGGIVRQHAEPDAQGAWALSGLIEGDWLVEVVSEATRTGAGQALPDQRALRVAADGLRATEQRDLGALTVPPAGAVRLRCLDSLTGAPLEAGKALARLDGASGALALPVLAQCGEAITGLNPGTWTIYRLPRLWERGTVRLRGGELQELVLGGDEAGEPQQPLGLALSRGEDGLQIDAVDANGLGAELGLQPGDRLTGAAIGPLSLPMDALLGKDAEAEAVLELLELASEAEAEGLLGAMGLHLEVEPAADDTGGAPPPG